MFVTETPEHVVDLELPEAERWGEVIAAERGTAMELVGRAKEDLARVPEVCRWGFAQLYRAFGGLYQGEIKAWAEAMGVSFGTATMLNCLYELSHLPQPKWFGCTAGVRWLDGQGLVHVRTLDWPVEGMGEATRLFRFRRGRREFVVVGVPGAVGVLSGMLPGAYSVTINWAPPGALPTFAEFGPTFLLREVLESCDTYSAAVERLRSTRLSTSVFFTVCGIEPDEACVIERTQRDAAVRPLTGGVIVQANHHIATTLAKNNDAILEVPPEEEVFSLDGSGKRVAILESSLAALPIDCSLEAAAAALDIPTVFNSQTCQKMVMCPRSGEIKLWRMIS